MPSAQQNAGLQPEGNEAATADRRKKGSGFRGPGAASGCARSAPAASLDATPRFTSGASPAIRTPVLPVDSRTDEELVAAANAGEAAAFETLYRRHRDWVLRVACRFTRDRDEALDVLQETFLYLLKKFPGFHLTSQLTTFLYPAVKNTAIARRRRRLRLVDAGQEEAFTPAIPARSDGSAACRDDLADILAGLPEPQREVLLMRFVDDMTPTEIASALDIPVGTAKSRLHGAIERLRADPRAHRHFEP